LLAGGVDQLLILTWPLKSAKPPGPSRLFGRPPVRLLALVVDLSVPQFPIAKTQVVVT